MRMPGNQWVAIVVEETGFSQYVQVGAIVSESAKQHRQNPRTRFLPFDAARKVIQLFSLPAQMAYRRMSKEGRLPPGLPARPDRVYREQGWKGWGDFLGSSNISRVQPDFLPFEEARDLARSLGIETIKEWNLLSKPFRFSRRLPLHPDRYYKGSGWVDWGDFLGTGRVSNRQIRRQFRSYAETQAFAREQGIKTSREWEAMCAAGKKPPDIPASPPVTYAAEWQNWGAFLGTGRLSTAAIRKGFLPYKEARKWLAENIPPGRIRTITDWREWAKTDERPAFIPADPAHAYKKKGWRGTRQWLKFLRKAKSKPAR